MFPLNLPKHEIKTTKLLPKTNSHYRMLQQRKKIQPIKFFGIQIITDEVKINGKKIPQQSILLSNYLIQFVFEIRRHLSKSTGTTITATTSCVLTVHRWQGYTH